MDFRKHITPLLINGERVETVTTFRFPGTHISANHSWTFNIRALVKKAQQWLHFLCVLRKDSLDTKLLLALYHSSVVSVHTLPECVVRGLHSRGSLTLPNRSLAALCPAWKTSPHPTASGGPRPSQETLHTLSTLICCPLDQPNPTPAG